MDGQGNTRARLLQQLRCTAALHPAARALCVLMDTFVQVGKTTGTWHLICE